MSHILIIDDDNSFRGALKRLLTKHGFSVQTAVDGRDGLKKIGAEKFDVVILDMWMPEKDGLETLIEIRQQIPDMKVIAISGARDIGLKKPLETAKRLGAIATLEKPFTAEELLKALEAAFASGSDH